MAINKPSPYVPSFLKAAMLGSRPLVLTWSDVSDTNISSTSSFQYDPHSTPLKSTQQLNVDWSRFENHTFFMSAEAKVNLAFDTIINGFPFDGTRQETEVFFDKLPGFERWVFDNFPRYRGELHFSGAYAAGPEHGTHVVVQNKTGNLFPEISRESAGAPVLNPSGSQSMTLEMQLFLPAQGNDDQVICQMLSGPTQGFSFNLLSASSTSSCTAQFCVVSGTSHMTVPVELSKGVFNHVAVVLNRDNGVPYLESYHGARRAAESRYRVEIGDLDIDGATLVIGSGTTVTLGGTSLTPTSTLSGSIDEFRFFHSARTAKQLASYAQRSLFATTDLVLYYRFNEPAGGIASDEFDAINAIVLDSSGNSLHALVSNYTGSLRINAATNPLNPLYYEHPDTTVVLFPAYSSTVAFNQRLLASASLYDQANPNLITRLVPPHYLLDGAFQDGFEEPQGQAGDPYSYSGAGIPGQGKMGNVQIMVSLLYIWARFFDDIKLYVDSFSTLRTVDYETHDTVPDSFLIDMVKSFGFHLPPLFNDSGIEQYIRGENVDLKDITVNEQSLRAVQNTLLRRVLINLPDVLKSKGTQHSIKSFLRAVGIDPGNNVRIREYGGPTQQALSFSRETKLEQGTMVQFFTSSLVMSPFLSASRVEPGYPLPAGTFGHHPHVPTVVTGTTEPSDGLLTSGSWTWEGIVKYTPTAIKTMRQASQSLVRLCTTGSIGESVIANLVAISSSIAPKLVLNIRPGASSSSPLLTLEIDTPIPGIFDFEKWNVSFGCRRGDDGLNSAVSSSYFLRLAYQNNGQIEYIRTTSSFFYENPQGEDNVLRKLNASNNASGSYLVVGAGQSLVSGSGSPHLHLNDYSVTPEEARTTDFMGRLSNVRFWSKALTEEEWREHVRNYNSTGVKNPLVNWNYERNESGSFERLRMNAMIRQEQRWATSTGSSGLIDFLDFSENGFHLTGSGFPIETDVVVGDIFEVSYLSPYFDEASSDEKIRIRSFQNQDLVNATPWAAVAPVHELVASERPTDDVRFTIEFSLVDALNRDIITMFATLDAMDNALGAPELQFSPDYPDLERMRNLYFNRIKEKLNFQSFFDFFRWFDTSIGTFIQQLVPRKTRFKGTNFTIESHMLERAKQEYYFNEIYLGDSNRANLNAVLLLQQIAGQVKKY